MGAEKFLRAFSQNWKLRFDRARGLYMLRAFGSDRKVAKNLLMHLQINALFPHVIQELVNALVEKEYAITRVAQE